MRADTIALVKQAVDQQRTAYVLVNNRSEGSAPSTVQALVDEIKSRQYEENDRGGLQAQAGVPKKSTRHSYRSESVGK